MSLADWPTTVGAGLEVRLVVVSPRLTVWTNGSDTTGVAVELSL